MSIRMPAGKCPRLPTSSIVDKSYINDKWVILSDLRVIRGVQRTTGGKKKLQTSEPYVANLRVDETNKTQLLQIQFPTLSTVKWHVFKYSSYDQSLLSRTHMRPFLTKEHLPVTASQLVGKKKKTLHNFHSFRNQFLMPKI